MSCHTCRRAEQTETCPRCKSPIEASEPFRHPVITDLWTTKYTCTAGCGFRCQYSSLSKPKRRKVAQVPS